MNYLLYIYPKDMTKQCRPRSDATKCGIDQGLHCLALIISVLKTSTLQVVKWTFSNFRQVVKVKYFGPIGYICIFTVQTRMVFTVKVRHYENTPIQYTENFYSKNLKFSDKKTVIFFVFLLKT